MVDIGFSPKTVRLDWNEYLHFWYSNNKGMGAYNCTIIRSSSPVRARFSRHQEGIRAMAKTSSWHGKVCISKRVVDVLGIEAWVGSDTPIAVGV